MNQIVNFLSRSFTFSLGKVSIPLSYLQAGAIIFLLFLLVLSLAQFRRHYVDWSLKGALFGILFGFILAIILEGFLLLSGKTVITQILGWDKAPKPISLLLDAGRMKLTQVLGVSTQVSNTSELVKNIQSLNPNEVKKLKTLICQP